MMERDLNADLKYIETAAGNVSHLGFIRTAMHGWPYAIKRALAAEGKAKQLEVLLKESHAREDYFSKRLKEATAEAQKEHQALITSELCLSAHRAEIMKLNDVNEQLRTRAADVIKHTEDMVRHARERMAPKYFNNLVAAIRQSGAAAIQLRELVPDETGYRDTSL
jgi:hypothetical protein